MSTTGSMYVTTISTNNTLALKYVDIARPILLSVRYSQHHLIWEHALTIPPSQRRGPLSQLVQDKIVTKTDIEQDMIITETATFRKNTSKTDPFS